MGDCPGGERGPGGLVGTSSKHKNILICRNLSKHDKKPTWMSKDLRSKQKVEVERVTSEEHRDIA